MASKKFTLLAILIMTAGATFAQLGGTLDYQDSTKIKSRDLPRYNEWKNNSKANVFPPKPKSMGQLSIYGGYFGILGDAPSTPGWNVGASYRKALGYVVSVRGGIGYGKAGGLDYRQNGNLGNNPVLDVYRVPQQGFPPSVGPGWYVHSYETEMWTPSLDLIINFNNIMFHKSKSKFALYGLIGYSPIVYRSKLDALRGNNPYGFASLASNYFSRPRKDIRKDLKDNFFDGSYETFALPNDRSPNFDKADLDAWQLRHSINFGLGTEFRVGSRTSLGVEAKWVRTGDDYIDGWFLNNGSYTADKDNLVFANFFININL